MAVAEKARRKLFEKAHGNWGEEAAMALMDYLPPGGWEKMATKADIERLRTEDLALLRADMDHGFTRLDGKIDLVAQRLDGKIDGVEVRLDGKIDLVSERLVGLDGKIDGVAEGLNGRIDHLAETMNGRFDEMATQLDATVSRALADLLGRQFRFVLAMLTLLGVVATVVSGVIVARL